MVRGKRSPRRASASRITPLGCLVSHASQLDGLDRWVSGGDECLAGTRRGCRRATRHGLLGGGRGRGGSPGATGTSATGGVSGPRRGGCGMMTRATKLSATGPVESSKSSPAGGRAMAAGQETQVSEAQIAVHWREEEYYHAAGEVHRPGERRRPGASSSGSARSASPSASRSTRTCSTWDAYWHTTLDTSNPPFWKWFVGGRLNACYNCVDRHLATSRNKAALDLGARAGGRGHRRRSPTRSCTAGSTSSPRCCGTSAACRPATG